MRRGHLLYMLSVAGVLSSGCGSDIGVNGSNSSGEGSGGGTTRPSSDSGGSETDQNTKGTGGGATSGESGGQNTTEGSGGSKAGKGGSIGSGGAAGRGKSDGTGGKKSDGGLAGSSVSGGTSGKGGAGATGGASNDSKDAGASKDSGTTGRDSGSASRDSGSTGKGGSTNNGTCTASKDAGKSVSGSGPHKVVMESNSDSKISCGTIYRPADLGGPEKYPIFVWGEGGCSRSGTSNQASMGEIASHGYFVVADGPVGSAGNCGSISMSTDVQGMAKVMIGYIDWAIGENEKSCSAYYQSLDTTKIAADGFSCGGLMAAGTAGDPRMTAVGITSSGLTSAVASYYKTIHTPYKILLGGSGDIAYSNGKRDYEQISALGIPVILLSKDGAGHGGDLGNGKGNFNSINLAWLNWQLKGDEGATGKGALYGSSCKYCNGGGWEYEAKNIE